MAAANSKSPLQQVLLPPTKIRTDINSPATAMIPAAMAVKTYCLDNSNYAYAFQSSMYTLMEEGLFCDVTLLGMDEVSLKAHSCVLAAASDVLKTCLVQAPVGHYMIKIQNISSTTWRNMLSYIYTGKVTFTDNQKGQLVKAASILGMTELQDLLESIDRHIAQAEQTGLEETHSEPQEMVQDTTEVDEEVEIAQTITAEIAQEPVEEDAAKQKKSRYRCQACGKSFPWGRALLLHEQMHKQKKGTRYQCTRCNKTVFSYHSLRAHERTHKYYPYKCKLCEAGFHFEINYELHMKKVHNHNAGAEYTCDECDKTFEVRGLLRRHKLQIHNSKLINAMVVRQREDGTEELVEQEEEISSQCRECDTFFPSRKELSKHYREVHQEMAMHQCPDCNKVLRSLYHLTEHRRSHTDEKPFFCSVCGEAFKHKCSMKDHERVKHPEIASDLTAHRCDVCGKVFRSSKILKSHELIHQGQVGNGWQCSECGDAFDHRGSYVSHMLGHKGERAYHCKYCDKGFPHKGNYTTHIQRHLGIKPYSCDHCNKTFVRKDDMKSHLRTHTGEKPYACQLCGMRFACISNLREHERAKHNTTFGIRNPEIVTPRNCRNTRKRAQKNVSRVVEADELPLDIYGEVTEDHLLTVGHATDLETAKTMLHSIETIEEVEECTVTDGNKTVLVLQNESFESLHPVE